MDRESYSLAAGLALGMVMLGVSVLWFFLLQPKKNLLWLSVYRYLVVGIAD